MNVMKRRLQMVEMRQELNNLREKVERLSAANKIFSLRVKQAERQEPVYAVVMAEGKEPILRPWGGVYAAGYIVPLYVLPPLRPNRYSER